MAAAAMASNRAGIKITVRMDRFFFANQEILERKFAEKKFYRPAKVLIKIQLACSCADRYNSRLTKNMETSTTANVIFWTTGR